MDTVVPRISRHFVVPILIFLSLYLTSLYSYLLFHSLVEIFSIVVAFSTFVIAWNARSFMEDHYFFFLGVAYLFVGLVDLFHTLAYKGMGVFPDSNANLPTQLWIAARYLEAFILLVAPVFLGRKTSVGILVLSLTAIAVLLGASLFIWKVFPDCFLEPTGLTPFKKGSEYLISLLLVGAIAHLAYHRDRLDPSLFRLVVATIVTTIAAELAFTFYISVYGLSNLVGHFLKLLSFYLIYKALIETGLKKPYDVLFRNLKESEASLRREKTRLEQALSQITVLRGLLPICAHCKKIRDDQGYWQQIESYITEHSDAEFTHGLCPDCAKKYFPDIFGDPPANGTPPT